jgi:scyllo-inositol 2-dehydrogenase (NADP+)
MNKTIPIAVVALGRAGWNIHVKQLRERTDFTIVDVADPDPARREEAGAELGCGAHPDIETLLKETKAEVVVVATPNILHESDAVKVLQSGRHCILEKPMADGHQAALRIIDAAAQAGKKVFVHHQRRFNDEFRFLREVIDSGVLGRIFNIRLFWGGFARRNDWQTLRKNGGGLLNNHGPHALDLVLNLLDAPVEAMLADLQHVKDAGDCEDHFSLSMKAANGQTAEVTCTTASALSAPRIMLLGSNGTLSADDAATAKLRYYDPSAVQPLTVIEGPAPERKYGTGEQLPWQEEEREIKPSAPGGDFYDNVRDVLNEDAPMVVTPESAAEVIRVIEWAHKTETHNVEANLVSN